MLYIEVEDPNKTHTYVLNKLLSYFEGSGFELIHPDNLREPTAQLTEERVLIKVHGVSQETDEPMRVDDWLVINDMLNDFCDKNQLDAYIHNSAFVIRDGNRRRNTYTKRDYQGVNDEWSGPAGACIHCGCAYNECECD